jgi:hypothetical protein
MSVFYCLTFKNPQPGEPGARIHFPIHSRPNVIPPSGNCKQFLFSFPQDLHLDSCWFLIMGHPLWLHDGSVIYSCYWAPPVESFRVWVPQDSWLY